MVTGEGKAKIPMIIKPARNQIASGNTMPIIIVL